MADTKITGLSLITPVGTDVFPIVDDPGGTPVTSKATVQSILDLVPEAPLNVMPRQVVAYQPGFTAAATWGVRSMHDGLDLLTAATLNTADGKYVTVQAAANNQTAVTGNKTYFQTRWDPDIEFVMYGPDVLTDCRLWFALCSTNQPNTSDTANGHCVAFLHSSVLDNGGWTPITRDGTDQTTGTAIGTAEAATPVRMRIRFSGAGTACHFSVNGGAEQTITTTLPTVTQDMGIDFRIASLTAGSTRTYGFGRLQILFGDTP